MKKKSDKIILLLIMILVFSVLSWVIPGGSFATGAFVKSSMARVGIYELFVAFFYSFSSRIIDVTYILLIGGCYGVLINTKSYRKLVDKTANLILNKEAIAMLIITLVMGLYVSISNQMLLLFCLVPFIVSVFLRNGCKKLTAISAAFGGIFIGLIGQTFGTYGMEAINSLIATLPDPVDSLIGVKIVIFVVTYALFNTFAIMYLNKYKRSADGGQYDLFCPEVLDESKVKKRNKTKIWPTIVMFSIMLIAIGLGYISWKDSFGINFFSELHTNFENALVIGDDVPLLSSLFGSYLTGFGEYSDLLFAAFSVFVTTIIIALINKISISDFIKYFGSGVKNISKVAFIYILVYSLVVLLALFPWPLTLINMFFGKGNFNIFALPLIAIVAYLFAIDFPSFGQMFGAYLIVTYMEDIASATLIWHLGGAIATVFVPTSVILLIALTYGDIPYIKWLGYIWKFVVSLLIAVFIILGVAILM